MTPRIEWAVFCLGADRDAKGGLVLRDAASASFARATAYKGRLALAISLELPPDTEAVVRVTLRFPAGEVRQIEPRSVRADTSGFVSLVLELDPPIPLGAPGDVQAEIRFDDQDQVAHLATLRLVPRHPVSKSVH